MKHYFITITLALLLCHSCRSIKEGRTTSYATAHHQYRQDELLRTTLFNQQDSTSRYWYFLTDTFFYYHPDSGLYGMAGELRGLEHQIKIQSHVETRDSLSVQADAFSSSWLRQFYKVSRRGVMKIAVAAALIIVSLGIWKVRKGIL